MLEFILSDGVRERERKRERCDCWLLFFYFLFSFPRNLYNKLKIVIYNNFSSKCYHIFRYIHFLRCFFIRLTTIYNRNTLFLMQENMKIFSRIETIRTFFFCTYFVCNSCFKFTCNVARNFFLAMQNRRVSEWTFNIFYKS